MDEKEFENWLSKSIEQCLILINNTSAYVKLEGLMKFEILDQLRNNIGVNIHMEHEQYKKVKVMIHEARHFFQVKLEHGEHYNVKVEQTE